MRLWRRSDSAFAEDVILTGQNGFVNSLAYVKPRADAPKGLIVSGGKDNIIYVHDLSQAIPLGAETSYHKFLVGHTDNVCALDVNDDTGDIISGSWDKTARVWRDAQCLYTLKGHENAVWAVLAIGKQVLTGSADKTIKLWREGQLRSTFHGHTDVVRALVVLPNSSNTNFASAGNDATIRLWSLDGSCLAEFSGHTNFIYSLVINKTTEEIVSSSEDRSVRVWKTDGSCLQTITHPAISVWSVAVDEESGDIVSGSSDGVVRIFTRDAKRTATPAAIKSFEEQVASHAIPSNQVGDVKKDNVQGIETLQQPGTKDGQVKMVRQRDAQGNLSDTVEAHQWSASTQSWSKIGDVVDAVGSNRKQTYNGKEYDYVFDIDTEEGAPRLKLPYNVVENPYEAAQRFINENEIPQMHLDEIANFIIKNAEGVNLGPTGGGYQDPFTGGSRYQPGAAAPSQTQTGTGGIDPWTRPAVESAPPVSTQPIPFPQVTYLLIKQGNVQSIKQKMQNDNANLADKSKALSEKDLAALVDLMDASARAGSGQISPVDVSKGLGPLIKVLRTWPSESRFPAIDFLRLLALQTDAVASYSDSKGSILEVVADAIELALFAPQGNLQSLSKAQETNLMLGLRTLVNLFANSRGEKLVGNAFSILFPLIGTSWELSQNRNTRLALMTLFLNYSVFFSKQAALTKGPSAPISSVADIPKGEHGYPSQVLLQLIPLLRVDRDAEVGYRGVVTFGTLISTNPSAKEIAKHTEAKAFLGGLYKQIPDPRIKFTSEHIIKLL